MSSSSEPLGSLEELTMEVDNETQQTIKSLRQEHEELEKLLSQNEQVLEELQEVMQIIKQMEEVEDTVENMIDRYNKRANPRRSEDPDDLKPAMKKLREELQKFQEKLQRVANQLETHRSEVEHEVQVSDKYMELENKLRRHVKQLGDRERKVEKALS